MNKKIMDVLASHGIERFDFANTDDLGLRWVLKTNPPANDKLKEELLAAVTSIIEIKYEALPPPADVYNYLGVALEDIHAGQRVEYCQQNGLLRKERTQ